jgi:hypothetical protein
VGQNYGYKKSSPKLATMIWAFLPFKATTWTALPNWTATLCPCVIMGRMPGNFITNSIWEGMNDTQRLRGVVDQIARVKADLIVILSIEPVPSICMRTNFTSGHSFLTRSIVLQYPLSTRQLGSDFQSTNITIYNHNGVFNGHGKCATYS